MDWNRRYDDDSAIALGRDLTVVVIRYAADDSRLGSALRRLITRSKHHGSFGEKRISAFADGQAVPEWR